VVTSGSRLRRIASDALAAAAVAVAVAVALAGCTRSAGQRARPTRPAGSVTRRATPVAQRWTRPGRLTALCTGSPAGRLPGAAAAAVPGTASTELVPLGVAADGRTGYASAWTPRFAGVAAVNLATGALRPILAFTDPATDQADGAWGGRWLVWEQTNSLQSLDGFAVYAWDSATSRIERLGHSLAGPAGSPWPSPWHPPAVSGSYAAWAQGYGPGGLVQVRLANLRTGRVMVIAAGHVQAPFFDGGLLVWPASGRPGAQTRLHAYSLASHAMAALPVALRAVSGTDIVAADGTRTAYLNPALTELYYSPAASRAATMVHRLPLGQEFAGLSLGAGVLAWTTTKATYLASTSTGRYRQVTPDYGFAVTGAGSTVLVADPPVSKGPHPSLPLHVIRAPALLAARRCGRSSG
jgi:hypothetical protein